MMQRKHEGRGGSKVFWLNGKIQRLNGEDWRTGRREDGKTGGREDGRTGRREDRKKVINRSGIMGLISGLIRKI
jgi:hypothetical protein